MNKRTIIIGDVHGCLLELEALLSKINYSPSGDQLYFTGDIINRGPYSKEVFNKVKSLQGRVVLGNHEHNLIRAFEGIGEPRKWIERFKREYGSGLNELIDDLKKWPFFIEEEDFILVHGGIVPGVPLVKTDPYILTNIRTWDGSGKNLKDPKNPPWFDLYREEKLVVFGHWAALEGVFRENVIGLDSGCVYGKKLSALIFPNREIVQVSAAKAYCRIKKGMLPEQRL